MCGEVEVEEMEMPDSIIRENFQGAVSLVQLSVSQHVALVSRDRVVKDPQMLRGLKLGGTKTTYDL